MYIAAYYTRAEPCVVWLCVYLLCVNLLYQWCPTWQLVGSSDCTCSCSGLSATVVNEDYYY